MRGNEGCSVSMIDLLEKINEIIDAMNGEHEPADIYSEDGRLIAKKDESEDERIRKWLADYFGSIKATVWIHRDITCEQILEWLEKQKEQKPNIEICPHSIKSKSYKETGYPIENCDYGLEIALDILEKTLGEVDGYQTDDGLSEHQTAIKAVKDTMKEQKPAEWSEEDERIIESLISLIETISEYYIPSVATRNGYVAWLKSLSSNLKKKNEDAAKLCSNEWSEEDEKMRTNAVLSLMYLIEECPNADFIDSVKKEKEWLKSIRPSWKPSEEQMRCFDMVLCDEAMDENVHRVLVQLREQLKRLM